MKRSLLLVFYMLVYLFSARCSGNTENVITGAGRTDDYKQQITGKNLAIVANQTTMAGNRHLVDTLLSLGMKINVIFAPEHGFRNMADAGEKIENEKDPQTGIHLISLYGSHLKPTPDDLKNTDIVIFDIQDVGVRFYTYISTLHYVMEACAENGIRCMVFDRPDPNGFYCDGNIPDTAYSSFVGMHPVPIVHGMTPGEYARMINGEGWLKGGKKCDLTVIPCKNYSHKTLYELPVRPSPNLPNQRSVYLYPSLCLFEGTVISCGRGTPFPFQCFGNPKLPDRGFSFTPESVPGASNPPLLGIKCYGTDLRDQGKEVGAPAAQINLDWLINAYNDFPEKDKFFTPYFDVLAGGPTLREQIRKGMNSRQIRETWKEGLNKFLEIREKYLLYK